MTNRVNAVLKEFDFVTYDRFTGGFLRDALTPKFSKDMCQPGYNPPDVYEIAENYFGHHKDLRFSHGIFMNPILYCVLDRLPGGFNEFHPTMTAPEFV